LSNFKSFLVLFLFAISLNSATAEYKVVSKSTPTRLTNEIVIPKSASGLKLKEIDVVGSRYYADNNIKWLVDDEHVLGAKVAGTLKLRAIVRYGWFGDAGAFEGLPTFALKIPEAELKKIPYLKGPTSHSTFNPNYDSFEFSNSDEILNKLFNEKIIDEINDKQLILVEQEANLVISEINFSQDCGMHYRAIVKSAKRVPNSDLILKNEGMNTHC
jgi:hypothetical protein